MFIELINTGSELLLGRVLNTNQQWLCRQLADRGYLVHRQVAVPDSAAEIQAAVREALARADLVFTTGGLGPTSDDITRDLIARLLGRNLREDSALLARIESFFRARKRPMPEQTRVQALIPEGALVLENRHGTAPGLAIEVNPNPCRAEAAPAWLIMLPGPPRELRPMVTGAVLPLLERVLPPPSAFFCRTLRATGIGESVVEERIAPTLARLVAAGLEVGYCARPGQVDVRLSSRGPAGASVVSQGEAIVRDRLGTYLYGEEEEEIEAVLIRRLTEQKRSVTVAESCTGGCVAHRLTNVPGASAVFLGGFITYSNELKQSLLGVSSNTLAEHGAVSEAVAREMAEGARERTGADYALSITGIAGPSGGTPEKPVGTVFLGLAGPFVTRVERHSNPLEREAFKQLSAQQALDLLRRNLPE